MAPKPRAAGIAGIFAGIGLAIEFACFAMSGWTAVANQGPETVLAFLQAQGFLLRVAGFVGVLNLALTVLFIAGLADRLHATSRTGGSATLYFGIIGAAAHGFVPIGFWLGVPSFVGLAANNPGAAAAAWAGFSGFLNTATGLGYLFSGLSLSAAGWIMASENALSRLAGGVALIAGLASALTVLGTHTPLSSAATAAFVPALLLTILFRVWGGSALLRVDV